MKKILIAVLFSIASFAQNEQDVLKIGVIDHINSVELGENRTLNIYLPDGYQQDASVTYPVIYLLDGSENEDLIHIIGVVQFLTMIEKMPKTIVVGIANVDRRRDFTFPTTIDKDKKDYPTTGSSAKFIRFIEKELQPYISKNYKGNDQRTIIGQSLGGLLAAEILIKRPELFSSYLIVSPSLWWNNESLLQQVSQLASKNPKAAIYIGVGSEGRQMENDAKTLSEMLQKISSLKVTFEPLPQENHLTILHNSAYKGLENLNGK